LKFLLDTHIWLWLLDDVNWLGRRTSLLLKDPHNELWISPVSTWEALTLHRKGRIYLHGDLAAWVARAIAGFKEAALTHEIMLAARQLPLHQDPSDRMLAATAQVLDFTLVTADERLLQLKSIRTLRNR
jgi:PIN domain nuclease of toxin-antitoxin system